MMKKVLFLFPTVMAILIAMPAISLAVCTDYDDEENEITLSNVTISAGDSCTWKGSVITITGYLNIYGTLKIDTTEANDTNLSVSGYIDIKGGGLFHVNPTTSSKYANIYTGEKILVRNGGYFDVEPEGGYVVLGAATDTWNGVYGYAGSSIHFDAPAPFWVFGFPGFWKYYIEMENVSSNYSAIAQFGSYLTNNGLLMIYGTKVTTGYRGVYFNAGNASRDSMATNVSIRYSEFHTPSGIKIVNSWINQHYNIRDSKFYDCGDVSSGLNCIEMNNAYTDDDINILNNYIDVAENSAIVLENARPGYEVGDFLDISDNTIVNDDGENILESTIIIDGFRTEYTAQEEDYVYCNINIESNDIESDNVAIDMFDGLLTHTYCDFIYVNMYSNEITHTGSARYYSSAIKLDDLDCNTFECEIHENTTTGFDDTIFIDSNVDGICINNNNLSFGTTTSSAHLIHLVSGGYINYMNGNTFASTTGYASRYQFYSDLTSGFMYDCSDNTFNATIHTYPSSVGTTCDD